MPTSEKNPTAVELSSILEELIKAKIKFILVGGLAAVVQGAPVTTLDVDIVYERSSENITKLLAFLKSIDALYRRPDDKVILPKEDVFLMMGHRLFTTRLGPLDVWLLSKRKKHMKILLNAQ